MAQFCPIIKGVCKMGQCMFYLPEGGGEYTFHCMVLGALYGLQPMSVALRKIATELECLSSKELGDYLEAIGNIGLDIGNALDNLDLGKGK